MIHSDTDLINLIEEIGFLPLLKCNIAGFSADEMTDEDCGYTTLPDGGWEWPLWEWKGPVVTESGCLYGKFFDRKAGFISSRWWPDFCNYRRMRYPVKPDSIEETILLTLREHGSCVTRDLRMACGFDGKGMRSRFDAYITQLQMGGHVITEDFVYAHDKHGQPYGWGLALLSTPERRLQAKLSELCDRTPEESRQRLLEHFRQILPNATQRQLDRIIG